MKKLLQKFRLYPDTLDGKAVLISFLIINFAFLFHTLNFMWGNHDVKFIKEELLFSSGLFEGRFTQFIPYRLLTGGQILPLLNNLLGFAFLTAALWLLAKYWNIKKSLAGYIVFISFCHPALHAVMDVLHVYHYQLYALGFSGGSWALPFGLGLCCPAQNTPVSWFRRLFLSGARRISSRN